MQRALLSVRRHIVKDNRHDLKVGQQFCQADGYSEWSVSRRGSLDRPGSQQKTIGSEKNVGTKGSVAELQRAGGTAHVAQTAPAQGIEDEWAFDPPAGLRPVLQSAKHGYNQ